MGKAVLFTFRNESSAEGVIAEIYFEDNMLLAGGDVFDNPSAVDFEKDFLAGNLPGGNQLDVRFEATHSFSAVKPAPYSGVGVGEELEIAFDAQAGRDIDDILSDLRAGELRIGLHVISFANGNSESFVNDDSFHTPEPTTFGLLCLGAILIRRK